MAEYAVMPASDYTDACNAVREKTGGTELIKSGELGNKIRSISGGGSSGVLPAGYTLLEYIESSGTQHINTKFVPDSNSRVVVTVKFDSVPTAHAGLFGSRTGTTEQFWCYYRYSDLTFATRYGTNQDIKISAASTQKNVVEMDKNTLVVNGNVVEGSAQTFTGQYEMYLFSVNQSGATQNTASFSLYSCQIYDNDVLVRDYLPCRNPENEVGLYDTVTKEFYGNVGAGAFDGVEVQTGGGVGIQSVVQTTTSDEDGGTNIITVTKTDGSTSTFSVKNGRKGSDGADGKDGYTPVKGVDYFDGEDGKDGDDGVGIQSVVQTTTSSADGGTNVITVTLTNGQKSSFTVKNGSKGSAGVAGSDGADGYTPVKGTDYFTEADKQEIVSDVLEAMPESSDVFVATYGVTTYDEVYEAFVTNKRPVMVVDGEYAFWCAQYNPGAELFLFLGKYESTTRMFKRSLYPSGWSDSSSVYYVHPGYISGGTFGGEVAAVSSGQTPGTSLLRNSKLVSADTTPTVNGEIFWTYK